MKTCLQLRTAVLTLFVFLLCAGSPARVYAEPSVLKEVLYLQNLKREQPEEYRRIVTEKRNRVREHTENLERRGSGRLAKFLERETAFKKNAVGRLKQEQPGRFREFARARRARWQRAAEKQPERFNRLLENRPQLRRRFRGQGEGRGPETQSAGRREEYRPERQPGQEDREPVERALRRKDPRRGERPGAGDRGAGSHEPGLRRDRPLREDRQERPGSGQIRERTTGRPQNGMSRPQGGARAGRPGARVRGSRR